MSIDYSEEAKNVLFGEEDDVSGEVAQGKVIFEDENGNSVINQYMLTQVMNGSTDGEPNTISAIMVNNYEEPTNPLVIEELVCENTPVQIYCMGGCLIVELYFPDDLLFEDAEKICKEYLAQLDNPELKDNVLVLTMTPTRVNYITMLAWNLIYADGYPTEDAYKLVLGFDNNKTQTVIAENLDLRAISESIERQIDMEQLETEHKIAVLEEEEKKNTGFEDIINDVFWGEDEEPAEREDEDEN